MSADGATGTVELVVARGKRSSARLVARYDGGRLVGIDAADPASPGADPPDVTLTLTPDDAIAVRDGALDLSVAFMRGQMKMSGDFGILLAVLPRLRHDDDRSSVRDALRRVL